MDEFEVLHMVRGEGWYRGQYFSTSSLQPSSVELVR